MRRTIKAGLACALAGLPVLALAAGFDCGKARTATERAICADAVRGVANNTRGLLMQTDDGRFWVALLDFGDRGDSEVRYYSNVPEWTGKLPRTVATWLESIDTPAPLRMMSEPDYR